MCIGKKEKTKFSNESGKSYPTIVSSQLKIYIFRKERGFYYPKWIPKCSSNFMYISQYICFYIYIDVIYIYILNSHRNYRRKEKKKKKNINGLIQLWTFSVQRSDFFFLFFILLSFFFLSPYIQRRWRSFCKIVPFSA